MKSTEVARKSRVHVLKMVHEASASHIGSALSIIDILAVLYNDVLAISAEHPDQEIRDRFILSKGHACVAVYAVLVEQGFIPTELLATYGQNGSILMNHISHKVPGVEFSTGSLGHGLPFGVGKAIAAKKLNKKWNTFVLLSDGELQEGSNWEAFMFAPHHKLDNVIAIIDYNNLQSLTTVDKTLNIQPLDDKLRAFGWHVIEVDGHDHEALKQCFADSLATKDKPTAVIANTIKGKGISYMENRVEWHYRSPSDDDLAVAMAELESA